MVDERPEEVEVYQITLKDAQGGDMLVAMAAFDLTFLNGQHIHAVVEVARALC